MDKGLIPRRYAKALYEVGKERNDNDALYAMMQTLAASFATHPALVSTIANPFVPEADKLSLLTNAVGGSKGSSNATYLDFIKLLGRNRRIDMAWDIARAFIDLYRTQHGIYRVAITSAAALGKSEAARLEAIIAKHIGEGTMEYSYSVDPALIGGFTVTVNSERLDASVATQLKQLQVQLVD